MAAASVERWHKHLPCEAQCDFFAEWVRRHLHVALKARQRLLRRQSHVRLRTPLLLRLGAHEEAATLFDAWASDGALPMTDLLARGGYFELYLVCLYASTAMLAGGQGTIAPRNIPEYVVTMAGNFGGLILFAIVQGTVCAMLTTGNPEELKFKHIT